MFLQFSVVGGASIALFTVVDELRKRQNWQAKFVGYVHYFQTVMSFQPPKKVRNNTFKHKSLLNKLLLLQKYRRDESESEDSDYVPYVPVKERKKQQLMKLGRLGQLKESEHNRPKSSSENETNGEEDDDEQAWGRKNNISLLDQHTELKKIAEGSFVAFFGGC